MPAFVIFDSTIGIQTLNNSDRLFVADGAVVTTSIVSSSAGTVAMGNNTQLTVAGTLHSSYGPRSGT